MKWNKKEIRIAAISVAAVAVLVLVVFFATRGKKEPVPVYSFFDGIVGMSDYAEGSESDGVVTADRVQPVYLSDTQSVLEILVSDGQKVQQGDVLFTYDTTLSQIALQQKELSVQQLKLDLASARQELESINSYVPTTPEKPPVQPEDMLAGQDLTGKNYLAFTGSGESALTPLYCWLRGDTMVDSTMLETLLKDRDVLFVCFMYTQDDAADGAVLGKHGVKVMRLGTAENGYSYSYAFFEMNSDAQEPDPGYTAAQLAAMRTQKLAEIRDLEFRSKVEEAEYAIMCREADSGQVTADFDGVVTQIIAPETAIAEHQPLMKVSGGGGYYVSGMVSELDLDRVQVGQKVTVSSWETGESYEGTVTEISNFPQKSDMGRDSNVTYYPYRVQVSEMADLQEGFYVSIRLQPGESQQALYVDNAYLRSDGAVYYVYARGADGRLEKRKVQIGGSLWGSYTQIRSGLTEDDWLAFPYGKTVKEGAPTKEGSWEDLGR